MFSSAEFYTVLFTWALFKVKIKLNSMWKLKDEQISRGFILNAEQ